MIIVVPAHTLIAFNFRCAMNIELYFIMPPCGKVSVTMFELGYHSMLDGYLQ